MEGGLAYCLVLSFLFVFFSISFFFCHEKCYTVAKKGFVTVVLTQYFVCPHSLLNLLFSGFTHTIRGRLGREKNMWALFYIFVGAAFSMGWDYAAGTMLSGCFIFYLDVLYG